MDNEEALKHSKYRILKRCPRQIYGYGWNGYDIQRKGFFFWKTIHRCSTADSALTELKEIQRAEDCNAK